MKDVLKVMQVNGLVKSLTLNGNNIYWDPEISLPEDEEDPGYIDLTRRADLAVWYGKMPESNGKSNWTALLYWESQGLLMGPTITLSRSEYPDRVRYEADRVRHMLGQLAEEPDILAYDEKLHSGYVSHVDATCLKPSPDEKVRFEYLMRGEHVNFEPHQYPGSFRTYRFDRTQHMLEGFIRGARGA